jgi:hypothetical protein
VDPLTTRAQLLELEAEMQRVTFGVTLAQAHAQSRPFRLLGSTLLTAAGWMLRRRFAPLGGSRLLGKLWSGFR